jgi:mannan endo-1,4-beta-mannosidase
VCHEFQLGWYAWEWGPGNGFNDPLCEVMDTFPDQLCASQAGVGAWKSRDSSPFGIQQTSVTPASI